MIRPATEHDLAELLALVRELAAFESLSDQCVCTEEDLHQVLFEPGATVFDTVAVADDGSVVGSLQVSVGSVTSGAASPVAHE